MSCYTGRAVSEYEALVQRLATILSTPVGSRVMMREFGSNLPFLVDRPINQFFAIQIYAATAEAIERWEPLFRLDSTQLTEFSEGQADLILNGTSLIDGKVLTIGELVLDLKGTPIITIRDASN